MYKLHLEVAKKSICKQQEDLFSFLTQMCDRTLNACVCTC